MAYIEKVSNCCYKIKKGFVPNMRVSAVAPATSASQPRPGGGQVLRQQAPGRAHVRGAAPVRRRARLAAALRTRHANSAAQASGDFCPPRSRLRMWLRCPALLGFAKRVLDADLSCAGVDWPARRALRLRLCDWSQGVDGVTVAHVAQGTWRRSIWTTPSPSCRPVRPTCRAHLSHGLQAASDSTSTAACGCCART